MDIKTTRTRLNWTQAELAKRAGVHLKTVTYWEARNGKPKMPSEGLTKIKEAFDTAGVELVRIAPETAMLAAFRRMPPEQQADVAMMVCGAADSEASST